MALTRRAAALVLAIGGSIDYRAVGDRGQSGPGRTTTVAARGEAKDDEVMDEALLVNATGFDLCSVGHGTIFYLK